MGLIWMQNTVVYLTREKSITQKDAFTKFWITKHICLFHTLVQIRKLSLFTFMPQRLSIPAIQLSQEKISPETLLLLMYFLDPHVYNSNPTLLILNSA